jgi:uncharacterized membrane protein YbaN (DUF454 family)
MNPLVRSLLITAGTLSVALAIVGIFIPILPTTPFLLLAAACYARSSDRFLRWLLGNRWLGGYIRSYREGRGLTRMTKALALAALWATLALSGAFAVTSWWVRIILIGVGVGVSVHLLRIKTYRFDEGAGAAVPNSKPSPSDES